MIVGCYGTSEVENGGEQVWHGCDLNLDFASGNRQLLLKLITGIGIRPSRNEGNAHAAFVVCAFLPTQRSGTGDFVLMPQGCIGTVVAEEKD